MIVVGSQFDERYEIIAKLGEGGFGTVFRARHVQFERDVAIKVLSSSLLQDSDGASRFEREAKTMSALRHKNIIGLYAYGVADRAPYMVLEYVDGNSLDDELRIKSQIEPMRALRLIRQVLEGLACAHSAGVIHRDLKPSNIMMTTDAESKADCVKLIDFGLVKLLPTYGEAGQKLTETGFALGTCNYMAPEQALGGAVDQRTDIYSTGCILYQMLAGRVPFNGIDAMEVIHQHLNDAPRPFGDALPPGVPSDALYELVLNCMAKDPADRYQSCAEAIADIDLLLDGKYQKLRSIGRNSASANSVQSKKTSRSQKFAWAIGTALFLGLIATGVVLDAKIKEQHRAEQIETAKAFVQEQMRRRLTRQYNPNEASKAKFMTIKADDDKYHFLSPSERYFVLCQAAMQDSEHAGPLADEALALFPEALKDGSRTLTDVADIYAKIGEQDKLLRALQKCVNTPEMLTRWEARRRLVDYYLARKEFKSAEAIATQNLDEKSKFTSTSVGMMDLGKIAIAKGEFQKAVDYYGEIAREHDEPSAYLGAARALFAGRRFRECVEWCDEANESWKRKGGKTTYLPAAALKAEAEQQRSSRK
jgi:serine/threonine protein kinase